MHENQTAAADLPNTGRVSSPAASGGAGMFFEQNVAAYWLAQLLVRCVPPILIDTVVAEVHFQTEHLGWHTDDFLVVCERPGATAQNLKWRVGDEILGDQPFQIGKLLVHNWKARTQKGEEAFKIEIGHVQRFILTRFRENDVVKWADRVFFPSNLMQNYISRAHENG